MNWKTITLQQFQAIHALSKQTDLEDLDKVTQVICILYDKTEAQVDDMTLQEYNKLAAECKPYLTDKIPGKPVKSFRIGTRKYAINYKPTTLKHRQYVEILSFSEKPVENMHNIMASLVQPVRWGFKRKNTAAEHSKIADDMLNAPLLAVYHSCVFFCKLYHDLMLHIRDYLIKEMMEKGATKTQAEYLMINLIQNLDGYSQLNR